jgi:hypothetical protein
MGSKSHPRRIYRRDSFSRPGSARHKSPAIRAKENMDMNLPTTITHDTGRGLLHGRPLPIAQKRTKRRFPQSRINRGKRLTQTGLAATAIKLSLNRTPRSRPKLTCCQANSGLPGMPPSSVK